MEKIAIKVLPVEIVCPPGRISELEKLDRMIGALRLDGAKDADERSIHAFTIHLNPEIPDSSAATVSNYPPSHRLTQDWLGRRMTEPAHFLQ